MILHLFEGYGVELEYMLVDDQTLDIRPIADHVLVNEKGEVVNELQRENFCWSNELSAHLIELKPDHPVPSLEGLAKGFHGQVQTLFTLLRKEGATLLPGAMHPWMNPAHETVLWQHENREFYEIFNRIFNCHRHNWANLQSVHLNLPFDGDEEFGRLHAAVRVVLPCLPGLAASSPIVEGKPTGILDNRLEFYRTHCDRIPFLTGELIPEPCFTRDDYVHQIHKRIEQEVIPHDPEQVLMPEWSNARGAITYFEQRQSIEIRLLDVQECPSMDLAIVSLITAVIRELVQEHWCSWQSQKAWQVPPLFELLKECIMQAENTVIEQRAYLDLFGLGSKGSIPVWKFWSLLADQVEGLLETESLEFLFRKGTLANRILRATGMDPDHNRLLSVYRSLSQSLLKNQPFE